MPTEDDGCILKPSDAKNEIGSTENWNLRAILHRGFLPGPLPRVRSIAPQKIRAPRKLAGEDGSSRKLTEAENGIISTGNCDC